MCELRYFLKSLDLRTIHMELIFTRQIRFSDNSGNSFWSEIWRTIRFRYPVWNPKRDQLFGLSENQFLLKLVFHESSQDLGIFKNVIIRTILPSGFEKMIDSNYPNRCRILCPTPTGYGGGYLWAFWFRMDWTRSIAQPEEALAVVVLVHRMASASHYIGQMRLQVASARSLKSMCLECAAHPLKGLADAFCFGLHNDSRWPVDEQVSCHSDVLLLSKH